VTHLADTVRFINDESRKPIAPMKIPHNMFDGPAHAHHFGCHIDHLGMRLRLAKLLVGEILVCLAEVTGVGDSRDIEIAQMSSLIIDEGDERRNDKGDPFCFAV
jgi:hypothetical protein